MIKTSRCLGRSLVCRLCYRSTIGMAAFMFCALLPLFSLADFSVRIKYFSSVGSTNVIYSVLRDIPDEESLHDVYMSHRFGILFKENQVTSPNFSTSTSWYYSLLNDQINPLGTGNTYTNSPANYPRVFSLYNVAASLKANGYTGPGFELFATVGTRACYNVYFPELIANVFSSTNSVYRSIVLSHLSAISSSVQNIELNVGGLQSSIDHGNSIVSNIDFNVSSIDSNLVFFSSNTVSGLSSVSRSLNSLENISSSISSGVDILNSDFAMNNLDVFLGDDTQTWVDFLNLCESSGLLSSDDVSSYVSELQATDPSRSKSYSIPQQHRRFYVKQQIKHTCVEAQKLRGRYQSFYNQVNNPDSIVSRSVREVLFNHVTYPINSGFAATITDWREDLRQQLQDWKHSDETGYLNVRDFQNRNFEAPIRPGSTNTVPFYSFITNTVTQPITNSVTTSAAGISSNIVEQSETTRKLFEDTLLNPDYPGVNVRIKYPLHGIDAESVHVHDDGLDQVNVALENLTDAMLGLTTGYTPSDALDAISNAVYEIYYFMTTNHNSYLLLDHYSDYISNGVYSASLDTFNEEFPNVYSNLLKYGLNHDNFWSLFGANLLYQSGLIGTVLEDLAYVRDFADSHIEGGFNEGISKIVGLFPSSSQIEDFLNSASNGVSMIDSSSSNFVVALSTVTNSAFSAFRPFKAGDFDSVPSGDLVFFKLPNEKYVTIPVSEQRQAWSLIHTGISFALIAVNIIFFPRFVLLIVLLFSKLSKRFVKFVPTDKM